MLKVLSLGAGVQSTTVLLMAARGELPPELMPDRAIFADTGREPQAVYRHLQWLIREVDGRVPVEIVTARQPGDTARFREQMPLYIVGRSGKPAVLQRQCTKEYKLKPIRDRLKEILGLPARVRVKEPQAVMLIGISVDEAGRAKDSDVAWLENRFPLLDLMMDRGACLNWLIRNGYPVPPKSSCLECPYHVTGYYRKLRQESPAEWREVVQIDREIRNGIQGYAGREGVGPCYLHYSMQPLEDLDTATWQEKGQQTLDDLMLNECEGMCGV